jgi:hypothetical protein
MKTQRLAFTRLAAAAFLGALLSAAPALADRAECEATCAGKGSETLQACMDRCPAPTAPGKGSKASQFQTCAMRCSQKYEKAFNQCSSRCPKDGPSGKEKAQSLPEEE